MLILGLLFMNHFMLISMFEMMKHFSILRSLIKRFHMEHFMYKLEERSRALPWLVLFHIIVIASSNFLVQIPMSLLGFHSTWGAFSYPFIFLATDLTVRIFGAAQARRIIFFTMFPALIVSYIISVLFDGGSWQGAGAFAIFNRGIAQIAFASFAAYVIGQMMDIVVFNRFRQNYQWWIAPFLSGIIGNLVDTIAFFGIAFYKTDDPYMAEHLVEVASVDYLFKMGVSVLLFLPVYGIILKVLTNSLIGKQPRAQSS